MDPVDVFNDVMIEVIRVRKEFGSFNSSHEGLSVIWEEFEELKAEVFKKAEKRSNARLRREALHVAAMGLRFMIDLT